MKKSDEKEYENSLPQENPAGKPESGGEEKNPEAESSGPKVREEKRENADTRENIIICDNLVKIYKTEDVEVLALQGLDILIQRGELMAIIGNSGSGKSTFLNMIGGLDRPSAGRLIVDGKDLFKLSERELVDYKRNTVGFVWQNNARNLLPYLTSAENVMMPMLFTNSEKKKREKALELLEMVGLSHRKDSKLSQMSGGEQQRVAIAIALANSPKILLADEPTGSVDVRTGAYILDVFKEINTNSGLTIVIVTHDRMLSKKVHRVAAIRDGKISSEMIMKQSYRNRMNEITAFTESSEVQDEYSILDRAGRVQIPHEILDQLNLEGNKVKLELQDGKVVISRPE